MTDKPKPPGFKVVNSCARCAFYDFDDNYDLYCTKYNKYWNHGGWGSIDEMNEPENTVCNSFEEQG